MPSNHRLRRRRGQPSRLKALRRTAAERRAAANWQALKDWVEGWPPEPWLEEQLLNAARDAGLIVRPTAPSAA